jgi:hypothetical protein
MRSASLPPAPGHPAASSDTRLLHKSLGGYFTVLPTTQAALAEMSREPSPSPLRPPDFYRERGLPVAADPPPTYVERTTTIGFYKALHPI